MRAKINKKAKSRFSCLQKTKHKIFTRSIYSDGHPSLKNENRLKFACIIFVYNCVYFYDVSTQVEKRVLRNCKYSSHSNLPHVINHPFYLPCLCRQFKNQAKKLLTSALIRNVMEKCLLFSRVHHKLQGYLPLSVYNLNDSINYGNNHTSPLLPRFKSNIISVTYEKKNDKNMFLERMSCIKNNYTRNSQVVEPTSMSTKIRYPLNLTKAPNFTNNQYAICNCLMNEQDVTSTQFIISKDYVKYKEMIKMIHLHSTGQITCESMMSYVATFSKYTSKYNVSNFPTFCVCTSKCNVSVTIFWSSTSKLTIRMIFHRPTHVPSMLINTTLIKCVLAPACGNTSNNTSNNSFPSVCYDDVTSTTKDDRSVSGDLTSGDCFNGDVAIDDTYSVHVEKPLLSRHGRLSATEHATTLKRRIRILNFKEEEFDNNNNVDSTINCRAFLILLPYKLHNLYLDILSVMTSQSNFISNSDDNTDQYKGSQLNATPLTSSTDHSVIDIFDILGVNMGYRLYALPQTCNTDHFVIIISPFKGEAICFTPIYNLHNPKNDKQHYKSTNFYSTFVSDFVTVTMTVILNLSK